MSMGHDTNRACGQGKRVSSFLFFYPMIPSKYDGKKQNIYEGGWGGDRVCISKNRMPNRGAFCFFKHLPHTGGKNIMVTYHLITIKKIKEGL